MLIYTKNLLFFKKSTYLIHLNPLWDENDYNRIDTLINKTGIKLGRDGMTIII